MITKNQNAARKAVYDPGIIEVILYCPIHVSRAWNQHKL